jgi:hypothetical protein
MMILNIAQTPSPEHFKRRFGLQRNTFKEMVKGKSFVWILAKEDNTTLSCFNSLGFTFTLRLRACKIKGIKAFKISIKRVVCRLRSPKEAISIGSKKHKTGSLPENALGLSMSTVASRSLEFWDNITVIGGGVMGNGVT